MPARAQRRGVRWIATPFTIAVFSLTVSAERLPVRIYTTRDGLGHNIINRIVSDSHGFLWFCTREGLSRFDGYEFVTYGREHGLPSADVNDVLEARDGRYWIATARGLVSLAALSSPHAAAGAGATPRELATVHDFPPHDVTALLQDAGGTIWAGTDKGLFQVQTHPDGGVTLAASEPRNSEIISLRRDARNVLWIGTSDGLYRRSRDGRTTRFTTSDGLPGDFVQTLMLDATGRLWLGTRTGGIARVAEAVDGTLRVEKVYSVKDGLLSDWTSQLFQSSDGRIWAASPGGVVSCTLLPNDECQFRRYTSSNGLPGGVAVAIAEDLRHGLWMGSSTGVARILPESITVFDASDGVPAAATVLQTPRGEILVADATARVIRIGKFNGRSFSATTLPTATGGASWGWNQMMLVDRAGDWWLGTRDGVLRFRGVTHVEQLARTAPTERFGRNDGMASDVIIRLFEDSRGGIWAATVGEGKANGLSRWDRPTRAFTHYDAEDGLPSLDRFFVSSFAEDREGNVWIGFSGDGGLVRYRGSRFTTFQATAGVPPGSLRNLHVDRTGRLWAGSYRGGLIRADNPGADRPRFLSYTTASGLSSNEVSAVGEDLFGRIYAATARGVDRLDVETGNIDRYRAGNGFPIGEVQGVLRDRSGALWFSYTSGLVRLVPTLDRKVTVPSTLITAVTVAGQSLISLGLGQSTVPRHEFHKGASPLQIEYVSPGVTTDEGLRYQFRLHGGESTWSVPTTQRSVTYGDLSPAEYAFEVRAVAPGGDVSSAATFAFAVVPPIWQRSWVLMVATLSVVAVAVALHRRRVARLVEIANVRARIATDLHDDIGANLTRISVLSEVAQQQRHAGAAVASEDHLAVIARVARESVSAMSDIVWAITPQRDTWHELRRRMTEYGEDVLSAGDCGLTITDNELDGEVRIGLDIRRDVYLIFKEAINNAARHARCSQVHVTLQRNGRSLRMVVSDDGRGFDSSAPREGNGLASMQRRAARLNGRFGIRSSPGAGTTITLEVLADAADAARTSR